METFDFENSMELEQELVRKACELEMQRNERREALVEITLSVIADAVESQASAIDAMTAAAGKALPQQTLRLMAVNEIMRAAADRLWCDHYSERATPLLTQRDENGITHLSLRRFLKEGFDLDL